MDERHWPLDRVALVARVLVIVTIMSHFGVSVPLRDFYIVRMQRASQQARVTSPSICR